MIIIIIIIIIIVVIITITILIIISDDNLTTATTTTIDNIRTACVEVWTEAVEVWQVMMRMSPSGSKRHRVKRMSTFSGQALPDLDGKPYKLLTSNSIALRSGCFAKLVCNHEV